MPVAMANMLDLPRELYLMICSDLVTKDLTSLARVSRDHYLAVQQPLFSRIRITSWGRLVDLVKTLTQNPIVSHISPKQRLHWYKLSDAQLRERDIGHLDLVLDSKKDGLRILGVQLSQLINFITRKCDAIKISLTLLGLSEKLVNELSNTKLPNVTKLTMFLADLNEPTPRAASLTNPLRTVIWKFSFSGSIFPDLRTVYMNDLVDCPKNLPPNIEDGFHLAELFRPRRRFDLAPIEGGPFDGLTDMQEIFLEYNTFLDADILKSLFASQIVPNQLTKLEIVNCPALHPIRDLEALAILLQRGLQLLQFLKLHLTWHFDGHDGFDFAYFSKINANPEYHLCNVVRELGQKIKGLDLAVPYACHHIFVPPPKKQEHAKLDDLELPGVPETPVNTLPQRLMAAGYRYRRLIFNEFCREEEDGWSMMEDLAGNQGENISWELLHDGYSSSKAMWLVSGCMPVEFSVQAAMQHPLRET